MRHEREVSVRRRLEVYSDPHEGADGPDYRSTQTVGEAGEVPVVLEGWEAGRIAVTEILPRH